MSLPVINCPTFDVVIPSTDKKIKCRPFLVKEEKILLFALEGKDEEGTVSAIKQIINNCVVKWNSQKLENLSLFDLEYLFLKLRAASKGEVLHLQFKGIPDSECPECKATKNISIDLNQIEVKKNPEHTNKIQLTPNVGITLKYPQFSFISKYASKKSNELEVAFEMIKECIESIFEVDTNKVYLAKEMTSEELDGFLESLTSDQFEQIQKFFVTMPKLEHEVDLSCKTCGRKESFVISGLQNFFQ